MVKRAAGGAALLTVLVATLVLGAESRVPYVPTPQEVVDRMLEIAKVGSRDYLIDLGSGDGRIVITAAGKKYGARGFGVDLNPVRIKEANENAQRARVTDKVAFYQRDLFETDLSDATVITMYLLPQVNLELRPKLLALKPGTRLVSHDFDMGDWQPDAHVTVDVKEKYGGSGGKSDIYFWVVPARIAGVWQWELTVAGKPLAYELKLEQRYQTISGSAAIGGQAVKLQNARLRGDEIRFAFTAEVNGSPVKHEFTGKVSGESIDGTTSVSGARVRGQHDWSARRTVRAALASPGPRAYRASAASH
jgi:SAM-dependent methyltransferase